ncbi:hypothetical protein M422DRAFT_273223 [Sphaerobolus stellatus SS14]|uniref:Unplaced genomic scaffold SPHSTscaffold_324, whole genome shotgun sequence n=1 Tax=Sphaerobolus stellatus (strain SS14) TaxID=990650 RepID=A0A0C9TV93_SPHS4|nr:hypothetical protein M422DRAFT_273223 [Sphaerobolus stellatus SS14]
MRVDLVKWWQDHQDEFPRLFQLALDYLPAQASSMPLEPLFEQLQMVKFMLKKDRLDFSKKWHVTDEDIEMDNRFLDCGLVLPSGNDDMQLNTILEFLAEGDNDDDEGAEGDIRDGEQPGADQEDSEYINIDDMDGYDDDEWDEI